MTTSDIEAHIQDIYGVDVSDTTVSRITDKTFQTFPQRKSGSRGRWSPLMQLFFWMRFTTMSAAKDRS